MSVVCERCREAVHVDAERCPHCGHTAGRGDWWTWAIVQVIGLLLTLTVIGAVIGLPIQYLSYRRMQAAKRSTVGVPAEPA